jgi:hypothetical protein
MLSSAWPQLIAGGAGRVFFANASKVSVTTPNGAAIIAGTVLVPCEGSTDVTAFDVVGSTVFWATRSDVCSAPVALLTHPTTFVAHAAETGAFISALATDAAWIVYAARVADGTSELRARPVGNRRTVVVARTSSTLQHVALAGSAAYWADGLAVRASPLAYETTLGDGPIVTSGPTMNIGTASAPITSLRVGALGAFVTTLRGLEHITLGTSRLVVPGPIDAFALDGTSVYWTSESRGIVARTSLFDGTTTTLAARLHPTGIAVDASSAYIIDVSQGMTSIVQITPK